MGETVDVKIKVIQNDKEEQAFFKVKRLQGKVDVPVDQLYINDVGVIEKNTDYLKLKENTYPEVATFE